MFTDKIEPIIYNVVANICVKDTIKKVIIIVIWSWNNYEVKLNTNKFNNVV